MNTPTPTRAHLSPLQLHYAIAAQRAQAAGFNSFSASIVDLLKQNAARRANDEISEQRTEARTMRPARVNPHD